MPVVSIIVPVYNVEKYLHCCLDSILAQTFTDIEVLLVDDGSSDGSSGICDEYAQKDDRVRVFHKANGGVSSARNLGLVEAKGEWIMFVDSDDKVSPQICERLLAYAVDGCIPICTQFSWKVNSLQVIPFSLEMNIIYPINNFELMGTRIYSPLSRLYNRRIIEQENLCFSEELSYQEDAVFNYEYFCHIDTFIVIDEPLYFYRELPYSLSHGRYLVNYQRSTIALHDSLVALAEKCHVADEAFYDRCNAHYFYSLCLVLGNNMRKDAPGTWREKIRRNNDILRSKEFKKVFPYRYRRIEDFTKRYMYILELSYYTGNYFWLWLLGVLETFKGFIIGKR